MYRLVVIAGPDKGSTYEISEGETSIGRKEGNTIVLNSQKISKTHCIVQISGDQMVVRDAGSSNGTFVNGVLTKARELNVGDRIGIGDCVLQLNRRVVRKSTPLALAGSIADIPQFRSDGSMDASVPAVAGSENAANVVSTPTDLKGKILFYFETYFMPVFYGFNLNHEWRVISTFLFSSFVLATLVISIYPLLSSNEHTVVTESAKRAQFIAKQLAESNAAAIAAGAETKTNVSDLIDRETGVRVAVITDLTNRIIAPASKANQYLAVGGAARVAVGLANQFKDGRETGFAGKVDSGTVAAIEPIKVLDPRLGRNIVRAMSIVAIDTEIATPAIGQIGMIYSETLIIAGVLGVIVLFTLYRLTLKRFEVLNEDMDKVLKGDLGQVTHEFKCEELDQLWDVINSALGRIPRGATENASAEGDFSSGPNSEDYVNPMKMVGDLIPFGLALCDHEQKVLHMNGTFEELTGLNSDDSVGHSLVELARDQAFGMLVTDMFTNVRSGGTAHDNFEFSGIPCKMHAAAFGTMNAKSYLLIAAKEEEKF